MGTAIGPAWDYLLDQLPARVQQVDPQGLVADCYALEFPPEGSPLLVIGADHPITSTGSGDSARAYVELGAGHVEEDFNIPGVINVGGGGVDQAKARRMAIATFDQVVELVASDLTLGGALLRGRWAEIGTVRLLATTQDDPAQAAQGRWFAIVFAVHCVNSYSPGS